VRLRTATVPVVLLAGVLGGCGVATQDRPEPVAHSMAPPPPTPTVAVLPDTSTPQAAPTTTSPATASPTTTSPTTTAPPSPAPVLPVRER